jgi:hypothetical protein
MPKKKPLRKKSRGNPYQWDKWFQKKRFRLKKHVHYECLTTSIIVQVRQRMAERKIKGEIKVESDEKILVTIY